MKLINNNTIAGQKYGEIQVVDEEDEELEIEDRETIQYRHRTFKDKNGNEIVQKQYQKK